MYPSPDLFWVVCHLFDLSCHITCSSDAVSLSEISECMVLCARFREKLGVKTVKALKRNNNGVTHAAVDMLCALMCVSISKSTECRCTNQSWISSLFTLIGSLQPMHDDYDLRQEQLNKASLLSSKKFLENLLEKFITNVVDIFFPSSAAACWLLNMCWKCNLLHC